MAEYGDFWFDAVKEGDTGFMKVCLDKGFDFHQKDSKGNTAIDIASASLNKKSLNFLLQRPEMTTEDFALCLDGLEVYRLTKYEDMKKERRKTPLFLRALDVLFGWEEIGHATKMAETAHSLFMYQQYCLAEIDNRKERPKTIEKASERPLNKNNQHTR
ncbi:MAG: ankyrin repeat domain-containing protein [Alphaproteobacteria bacterium]|nr:ankyrin repeat domain-containing protein [Alphaproteobacteria bacterium]